MSKIWKTATIIYGIALFLTGCNGSESFPFNPMAPIGRPLSNVAPSQRFNFYADAPAMTIEVYNRYLRQEALGASSPSRPRPKLANKDRENR